MTLVNFHISGKIPASRDLRNILHRGSHIDMADSFKSLLPKPSGPVAFDGFNLFRILKISNSVMLNLSKE